MNCGKRKLDLGYHPASDGKRRHDEVSKSGACLQTICKVENDDKDIINRSSLAPANFLPKLSLNKCPEEDALELLGELSKELRKEEERLRKLKMVKMYREKNDLEELEELIDKWREVCQQSIQDLHELLPLPRPSLKELVDNLQIEHSLVHFDPENESFS